MATWQERIYCYILALQTLFVYTVSIQQRNFEKQNVLEKKRRSYNETWLFYFLKMHVLSHVNTNWIGKTIGKMTKHWTGCWHLTTNNESDNAFTCHYRKGGDLLSCKLSSQLYSWQQYGTLHIIFANDITVWRWWGLREWCRRLFWGYLVHWCRCYNCYWCFSSLLLLFATIAAALQNDKPPGNFEANPCQFKRIHFSFFRKSDILI